MRRCHVVVVAGLLVLLVGMLGAEAKTRLGFVSQFTDQQDARGELWRGLVRAFNESQEAVEVEILSWGSSSPGPQNEKMLTWVAGGQAPDVFEFHGTNHQMWAVHGLIADLTPYLDRDPAIDLADFYPAVLENYMRTGKGRLFALPLQIQVYALEYNQAPFDDAGLDVPPKQWDDSAWNWDTFVEIGKKLTISRSGQGEPDQHAFQGRTDMTGGLLTYVWQSGGDVVDEHGNYALHSPEAMRALQYVVDLKNLHGIARTGGFPRQSAMRISTPSGYPVLQAAYPDITWDVAPLPRGPVRSAGILGSTPLAISAQTKYPQEAWEFFKYLLSPDFLKQIVVRGDHVPVRRSILQSRAFREIPAPASYYVAAEAVSYAYSANDRGPNWGQIASIIQNAFDQAWNGYQPLQNAMEEIRGAVEALFREGWEQQR
ncbi:MAG: ABC transporter substrate-binding protein [Limnochordia bacterium]|jgi:multiple sugar transport system substrate-binding protein